MQHFSYRHTHTIHSIRYNEQQQKSHSKISVHKCKLYSRVQSRFDGSYMHWTLQRRRCLLCSVSTSTSLVWTLRSRLCYKWASPFAFSFWCRRFRFHSQLKLCFSSISQFLVCCIWMNDGQYQKVRRELIFFSTVTGADNEALFLLMFRHCHSKRRSFQLWRRTTLPWNSSN